MKTKYIAIAALLFWLGVTGWLTSLIVVKPVVPRFNNDAEDTAEMANLRQSIDTNKRVVATLNGMTAPSLESYANGPLIAVSSGSSVSSPHPGAGADDADDTVKHEVSLVLVAGGSKSAVIDGEHVRVGQRLSNGAKVQAIGDDWVRIADKDSSPRTWRLPAPGQAPKESSKDSAGANP